MSRLHNSHLPSLPSLFFLSCPGVRIFDESEVLADDTIEAELKDLLTGLARHLFGKDTEIRWRDDYFPFTHPSFELDVYFNGNWMEVLGCGVIHPEVLANAGLIDNNSNNSAIDTSNTPSTNRRMRGWAFGLGLERLAMVLFSIPGMILYAIMTNMFAIVSD